MTGNVVTAKFTEFVGFNYDDGSVEQCGFGFRKSVLYCFDNSGAVDSYDSSDGSLSAWGADDRWKLIGFLLIPDADGTSKILDTFVVFQSP